MAVDLLNEHDVKVRMMVKAIDAAEKEELRLLQELVRPNYGWDDQPARREEQADQLLRCSALGDGLLRRLKELRDSCSADSAKRRQEIEAAIKLADEQAGDRR